MTKLWILSDTHYDFGGKRIEPPADADVAVIAGDAQDDEWLARIASMLPTVYVAGNHDFYGHDHKARLAALHELSTLQGFYYLDDGVAEIEGILFAGATLWTDYGGNPAAADAAERGMNDHRLIGWGEERFLPRHAKSLHEASVEFIATVMPDVVVTHHAPSRKSVHPRFREERHALMNRAFYSDLDHLVKASTARLWVHGHMHNNADYMLNRTRVLCNPKGYPRENPDFNPALIVEV